MRDTRGEGFEMMRVWKYRGLGRCVEGREKGGMVTGFQFICCSVALSLRQRGVKYWSELDSETFERNSDGHMVSGL